jgi:hypothetical protein
MSEVRDRRLCLMKERVALPHESRNRGGEAMDRA